MLTPNSILNQVLISRELRVMNPLLLVQKLLMIKLRKKMLLMPELSVMKVVQTKIRTLLLPKKKPIKK
jgi:hypothetical protein